MRGRRPDISKMKTIYPNKLINLEAGIKKLLENGLFELNQ